MKVLETYYKGNRFRSRLEARWAVFLDNLKVKYQYEVEGFDLDGKWYLPDFHVSDWNCWIEIKSTEANEEAHEKCAKLAIQTGERVLLIAGQPWVNDESSEYDITLFEPDWRTEESSFGGSGWTFGQGRRCEDEVWLVRDGGEATVLKDIPHDDGGRFPLSGIEAYRILEALEAGRQARFEK